MIKIARQDIWIWSKSFVTRWDVLGMNTGMYPVLGSSWKPTDPI